MHWRTSSVDNTVKEYKIHLLTFLGSKVPLGLLTLHFKFNICKKTQKKVKSQGVENIEEMSKNDMNVLSTVLAEKKFMFGDEPAMLDMVLHSHLGPGTAGHGRGKVPLPPQGLPAGELQEPGGLE